MGTASGKKGKTLEDAVEAIHDSILRGDPKYRGLDYTIDTRVRRRVRDVDYEIDVLVETPPTSSFPATWIFECKNWKDAVGVEQLAYLAHKVEALGASRGFLVAPAISPSAAEFIKTRSHLEHIPCTEEFSSLLNSAQVTYVCQDVYSKNVEVHWEAGNTYIDIGGLTLETMFCSRLGQELKFEDFVAPLFEKAAEQHHEIEFRYFPKEGTHWRQVVQEVQFVPRELYVQKREVNSLLIRFDYLITFQRRRLISKFQLQGRGQTFEFESVTNAATGQEMKIRLIERLS